MTLTRSRRWSPFGGLALSVAVAAQLACQPRAHQNPVLDPASAVPGERYRISAGNSPARGPTDAKVTIIEFADFQCPYSKALAETLKDLQAAHGADVRIEFRHHPLSSHPNARLAALAAIAADAQGKFWEMHDALFAHADALTRPDLERYAAELKLDVAVFKTALDQDAGKPKLVRDVRVAGLFGALGTPTVFVNGRAMLGAPSRDALDTMVGEELQRADALLQKGTPRAALYAALVAGGKPAANLQANNPGANNLYKIPAAGAPTKGPASAKVTLVEYGDYDCQFCQEAQSNVLRLLEEYGDNIRFYYKDAQNSAQKAAGVRRAAAEQGKGWAMHDAIMRGAKSDRDALDALAGGLGLDRTAFFAKLGSTAFADETEKLTAASEAEAAKFQANRTPTFFFNGHPMVGALPYDQMHAMVDREIALADAALARGVAEDRLYDELTKDGFEDNYLRDAVTYKVDVEDSPVRGPGDAAVTLVLFSDFECPFCGQIEPELARLLAAHPADVRVVWKNFPLPMHAHAELAALVAQAAGEQGKFWEMHDLLFKNQEHLERADLDGYARTLGLDLTKFAEALEHAHGRPVIERDKAQGGKLGVSGTPGLFVNGKQLDGDKTFAILDAVVTNETKRVADLVAKGAPRAQIYEALMQDAKLPNAAPPPADTAASKPAPKTIPCITSTSVGRTAKGQPPRRSRSSSSQTSSAHSAKWSNRRSRRSSRPTRTGSASCGRTFRSISTRMRCRPPRRRWRPARRASSGRCTTSCSRSRTRSRAQRRIWRTTPDRSAWI